MGDIMAKSEEILGNIKPDTSIDTLWNQFKSCIHSSMTKHIPTKLSSHKTHLPWLTSEVKHLMKSRDRLYYRYHKSRTQANKLAFLDMKHKVQRATRSAYWEYVNNIIVEDPECEHPKASKRFWSFIKGLQTDSSGVAPLKDNGVLIADAKGKAEILNKQYTSVFTREDTNQIPSKGPCTTNIMPTITIGEGGVLKLLQNLNPHKASGPDSIPTKVLRECATEVTPLLTTIMQRSLMAGHIPSDWASANVTPVFKKGEKFKASNYRPVSLTCVCSKLMELL
jgi:hypothetical protein